MSRQGTQHHPEDKDETMTTATQSLRILGVTDERTDCECCGKSGLKCTVALEHMDGDGNGTGEVVYYGRDCASRVVHGNNKSGNVKSVERLAKSIEYAKRWLGKTDKHTAKVVANAIRVWGSNCHALGASTIKFDNGVTVTA
jgi:hypothetical protein